jgi:ABC-type dipeptide/oligopeptide/nickel transport system ATPase component
MLRQPAAWRTLFAQEQRQQWLVVTANPMPGIMLLHSALQQMCQCLLYFPCSTQQVHFAAQACWTHAHALLAAAATGHPLPAGADLESAVESSLRAVNLWNNKVGDKQARQYSGGMKRRLSVAISFTGNPLVVYLDEPSTVRARRSCSVYYAAFWVT